MKTKMIITRTLTRYRAFEHVYKDGRVSYMCSAFATWEFTCPLEVLPHGLTLELSSNKRPGFKSVWVRRRYLSYAPGVFWEFALPLSPGTSTHLLDFRDVYPALGADLNTLFSDARRKVTRKLYYRLTETKTLVDNARRVR